MFCNAFKATMSTHACIRRQKWSTIYKTQEGSYDHSLLTCQICNQGRQVKRNPDSQLDRDFDLLKENQLKVIRDRGYIFKDSVALESLLDSYDCSKIKLRRESHGKSRKDKRSRVARLIAKHRYLARSKQNILQSNRSKLSLKQKLELRIGKNRRRRRHNLSHD